jgi:hypothetical protein
MIICPDVLKSRKKEKGLGLEDSELLVLLVLRSRAGSRKHSHKSHLLLQKLKKKTND